jgi:L-rhamnose mutarotase
MSTETISTEKSTENKMKYSAIFHCIVDASYSLCIRNYSVIIARTRKEFAGTADTGIL